jgi:hypothetical protein
MPSLEIFGHQENHTMDFQSLGNWNNLENHWRYLNSPAHPKNIPGLPFLMGSGPPGKGL